MLRVIRANLLIYFYLRHTFAISYGTAVRIYSSDA